jgi:shikimate kinase
VIALIGARWAGKTTVGRLLASELARPFADLDEEIARRAGVGVAELLRRSEPNFRALESAALREIAGAAPVGLVLALGGGAPMRAESQGCLRRFVVIHLRADPAALRARMRSDPAPRPPLLGSDPDAEIERLLEERLPTYVALADWDVDTDALDPQSIAESIARRLVPLADLERERWKIPPRSG